MSCALPSAGAASAVGAGVGSGAVSATGAGGVAAIFCPLSAFLKNADLVVSQIQDAIKQGKDLKSLSVKINGGASKLAATNIWDDSKMENPPNHNLNTIGQTTGGLLPAQGWVRKSDNVLARAKQPIPDGRSGASVNITPADKGLTGGSIN